MHLTLYAFNQNKELQDRRLVTLYFFRLPLWKEIQIMILNNINNGLINLLDVVAQMNYPLTKVRGFFVLGTLNLKYNVSIEWASNN